MKGKESLNYPQMLPIEPDVSLVSKALWSDCSSLLVLASVDYGSTFFAVVEV